MQRFIRVSLTFLGAAFGAVLFLLAVGLGYIERFIMLSGHPVQSYTAAEILRLKSQGYAVADYTQVKGIWGQFNVTSPYASEIIWVLFAIFFGVLGYLLGCLITKLIKHKRS